MLHTEITGIAEGTIHKNLKRIPSKISFMFDAWMSALGDPYLSLTAHFIDAPANSLTKSDQLICQEIEGWHMGKNMSDILSSALDKYGLCGKV
jgi:hypothetical protein